jgi:hypothetical protein
MWDSMRNGLDFSVSSIWNEVVIVAVIAVGQRVCLQREYDPRRHCVVIIAS